MLKDKILDYIQKRDWVSFVELEHLEGFKDVSGEEPKLSIQHPHFNNIVLWVGITTEAADALAELTQEGRIHWMPGEWLSYAADGAMMKLPLVKKAKHYARPHWLPAFYRPGPRPKRKEK